MDRYIYDFDARELACYEKLVHDKGRPRFRSRMRDGSKLIEQKRESVSGRSPLHLLA